MRVFVGYHSGWVNGWLNLRTHNRKGHSNATRRVALRALPQNSPLLYVGYLFAYLLGSSQSFLPAAAWNTLVSLKHANENIQRYIYKYFGTNQIVPQQYTKLWNSRVRHLVIFILIGQSALGSHLKCHVTTLTCQRRKQTILT